MYSPALQQLTSLVPPPDSVTVGGETISPALGGILKLPEDYVEFINTYGAGAFTTMTGENLFGELHVYDLRERHLYYAVEEDFQILRDWHKGHPNRPDEFPAVYPQIPGLLPWATWDQGFSLCWTVMPNSQQWPIHAIHFGAGINDVYHLTVPEYLLSTLRLDKPEKVKIHMIDPDLPIRYIPLQKLRSWRPLLSDCTPYHWLAR